MKKLFPINRKGKIYAYMFWCPGCEGFHIFKVEPNGWSFNGNKENPTFSPSLAVTFNNEKGNDCHLFLRNGKLVFLSDCKHSHAGKTVVLPDLPEEWQNTQDSKLKTQD